MKETEEKPTEMTINAIARLSGIDRRTVAKRLVDVEPVRTEGRVRFYDPKDIIGLLKQAPHALDERRRLEIKKLQLQCDSISFENKIRQGQFMPVHDVRRTFIEVYSVVKAKLLAIPGNAAPWCAGKGIAEIAQELKQQIHAALRDVEGHRWNNEPKHEDESKKPA